MPANIQIEKALQIVEDAWSELQRGVYVQHTLGARPLQFPDLSIGEAHRRTVLGKSLLDRLATLDRQALPLELALNLRLVEFKARTWMREEDWYWTVIDPLGIGIFGMFLPTPYCGGWLLNQLHGHLASFSFETPEDTDHYLSLIEQYRRIVEQFGIRTEIQAQMGTRMPRVQVWQARRLLTSIKASVRDTVGVSRERLARIMRSTFLLELEDYIAERIEPAFDAVLNVLSENYQRLAPETVGLGQYSEGASVYAELVKLHTTIDLTPEQVNAIGRARMEEIQCEMRTVRARLHFDGDHAAFLDSLGSDPRWHARTVDDLKASFARYIDRIRPRLRQCFHTTPRALCEVLPLPAALQGSMTYGYYSPPRGRDGLGQYFFNASHLTTEPLLYLASLTYHELMPGHHLQSALQQECETLHPLRRHSVVSAYEEAWAEYAATLAAELGGYVNPEERYGRLVMDAFLTCRLVVDTGMNALGWSLERAQQYAREHTGMSEAEIASDCVRYSCDIPGQALAYKLGDVRLLELRDRMRTALGQSFDLKEFHAAVLGAGAVPLPDLEWYVERSLITQQLTAKGAN